MIGIYEPLYRPGQELREPGFLPLRVANTDPGWRELAIIVGMYRDGLHRRHAATGLFSPRFRDKTKISGDEFVSHVRANPGADVWIVNPTAHLPYYSYNVWMEGEWLHPGLGERAQALVDACGIGWRISETPRQPPRMVCYANFWVGTEKFWDDYVGGVLIPIAEFLERHPEDSVAQSVLAQTYHRIPTPFLPFITERLFSTYLSHARPAIAPYMLDPVAACWSDFERDILAFLGERVMRADREGHFPPDLIAWMNLVCRLRIRYRLALYTNQAHPHLGTPIDPGLIETGIRELNAAPLPPLPV